METDSVAIRRQLCPADVDAIVALHERVYRGEYGAGEDWVEMVVRLPMKRAVARGWPPRARGMHKLEVQTFSALAAAAHIYRDAGFQAVWEREADWHGSRVAHQVYELVLHSGASSGS